MRLDGSDDACPAFTCPGSGDCCVANGSAACETVDCCNAVCETFPSCCEDDWTQDCVDAAVNLCGGNLCRPGPGPGSGDCCVGNGTPGCGNSECRNAVCAIDPVCCSTGWDQPCAELAKSLDACSICKGPRPPTIQCLADTDCVNSPGPAQCNPQSRTCVGCNNAADCLGDAICVQGVCYPTQTSSLSFLPPPESVPSARGTSDWHIKLTLLKSELFPEDVGMSWWATGEPGIVDFDNQDRLWLSGLSTTQPSAPVELPALRSIQTYLGDCPIHPGAEYMIELVSPTANPRGAPLLPRLILPTVTRGSDTAEAPQWGDVAGPKLTQFSRFGPADGVLNVNDLQAVLFTFLKRSDAPVWIWVDVAPAGPNQIINVTDVQLILLAIQGRCYPFCSPSKCVDDWRQLGVDPCLVLCPACCHDTPGCPVPPANLCSP